jgi:hypothetical protein
MKRPETRIKRIVVMLMAPALNEMVPDKVTFDHEPEQVLVLPEFPPVDAPPGTTGANDGLIGVLHDL